MNQHFKHQIIIKRQCTHVHTYRIKNLKKTTHNKTPHCQKGKMKLQNVSRNFIKKIQQTYRCPCKKRKVKTGSMPLSSVHKQRALILRR